ncbi:MAG: hypothetical protein FD167_1766 [bacterium]|nr:MAG: hypothetical protein FD167_1766 [bacterium]
MLLKKVVLLALIIAITFNIACNNSTENVTNTPTQTTPQITLVNLDQARKELTDLYTQITNEFKDKKNTTLLSTINKDTKFKSELENNKWTSDGEKIRTTIEDNLKGIQEIKEMNCKINSVKTAENGLVVLEIESSIIGKYAVPNTPITAELASKGKSSVNWAKKEGHWVMISWQDLGGTMSTDGNESEGSYFLGL